MSKFVGVIIGGLEILGGAVLIATGFGAPLGAMLISAGVGTILTGVGTLLSGSGGAQSAATGGVSTASRNPVAPWLVVYGRSAVGGTIVHLNEFGSDNKWLDIVIVLACHPCQAVDALLFDKQLVRMTDHGDGTYDSFTPTQETVSITSINRVKGVVTVHLSSAITLLSPGDNIVVSGLLSDTAFNGKYPVGSVSGTTCTYICGGDDITVSSTGSVTTTWPDYGAKVHMEVLLGNHSATFPGMLNGTPVDGTSELVVAPDNRWTAEHKLLGKTSVMLRLHYDQAVFASGIPQASFLVRGKNDIYDPRDGNHKYTENAALCTADYLNEPTWGFRAQYGAEIPLAELGAAANICDESVFMAIGTTEPRYAINGKFDLSAGRGEILRNMLTASAGRLTYQGGQFRIWPAAWQGISTGISPAMGDLTGSFRWKPTASARELYNGVKGTYVSPANNWQASDIPPYAQDADHGYGFDSNLIEDGGTRRWLDVQLPFTISPSAAQRICKIELLRRRHQGTGTFRMNMTGYCISTMDVIPLDVQFFAWAGKQVEVLAHRFTLEKDSSRGGEEVTLLGTEIDVQETDSEIYDWDDTEELSPEGYQQPAVPDPTKPAPITGLTLTSNATTVVITPSGLADSILVQWIAPTDAYVTQGGHIEVQYRELVTYSDRTITIANGSHDVIGDFTDFLNVMTGGTIVINGASYVVKTVISPTHLFLVTAVVGTGSGLPFVIGYSTAWKGLPSVNPSVTEVRINGVVDGAQYYVQARSVNAGGVPSAWVSAGPVTASGAKVPNSYMPYAQNYLFAPHGFGIGLSQIGGFSGTNSIRITGVKPVNDLSTVTPPEIDAYAVVTSGGSPGLPVGSFVAQVFGITAGGKRTAGSNLTQFRSVAFPSKAAITVAWGSGTVGYEVFVSDRDADVETMIGLGPQTGTPTTISIETYGGTGYGPPDPRAVAFHARAKRVIHAGIAAAGVISQTNSSITIGVPEAPTADLWIGRYAILISKVGLPETQEFSIHRILHNDAASPCTLSLLSPEGGLFSEGDLVLISTLATASTNTSITDNKWAGPFASGGLDPDASIGNLIRILYDPTGAALPGDTVRILGNTGTSHTTTPFRVTPGIGTVFIEEEPAWRADVVTTAAVNAQPPSGSTLDSTLLAEIPSALLAGYVALVELLTQDTHGNDSTEIGDDLRMLYIVPPPDTTGGGNGDPVGVMTPGADGSFTPDLSIGTAFRGILTQDARANPPINVPSGESLDWTLEFDEDSTGKHSIILDPGYNCNYAMNSGGSPANTRCVVFLRTDQSGNTYPTSPPTIDQPIP
jgi:hypothetical protein